MTLQQRPISIAEANRFVGVEHRHLDKVAGGKFALAAYDGDRLCGVAIVGRTTARGLHHPARAEITRLATDGTFNACSFLEAKAKRVVQAMGYDSLKTYNRADESGASLRAVRAELEAEIPARSWAKSSKARPRVDQSAPAPRRRYELLSPRRPVLRYHGGKFRLAPWIIEHFPAHRVYVEPFGGGGSVLLRKPRSDFEVYNDLDSDVVNVFRVLRDPSAAAELERLLRLTPWARTEFTASYQPTLDPIERARRTIVRCFMGHGTTSRRLNRTGFRAGSHPSRKGGGFGDWGGYPNLISQFTERLQGVVIEERDALDLIVRHDGLDALFYIDPPYPHSTRSTMNDRRDSKNDRAYRHEMSDDDHRRLAVALSSCMAAVVVSGYACPLYDQELYAGWGRFTHKARADRGRDRTEVIWTKAAGVIVDRPSTLAQANLFAAVAS